MHKKIWIAIVLLSTAITYIYVLPKQSYKNIEVLHQLKIPLDLPNWKGTEIKHAFKFDGEPNNMGIYKNLRYVNVHDKLLYFTVFGSDNWHSPKVCSKMTGFEIINLGTEKVNLSNNIKFNTTNVFAQKEDNGFLIIYWLCIDKKVVNWAEQKLKVFWYSLFNKEIVGIMIRIDVPCKENKVEEALELSKQFLTILFKTIDSDNAKIVFGVEPNS